MATAPGSDELIDEYLSRDTDGPATWNRSYNKLQCPECGGLHDEAATECSVCGWAP